jgi:hypothetical protein
MSFTIKVILSISFRLLAVLLTPLLPLFAVRGQTYYASQPVIRLPMWLAWFDTFDDSIDSGHINGFWETPNSTLGFYWSRVKWLWRNPAYGFDFWLLGAWLDEPIVTARTTSPTGWHQRDTSGDIWGTHGVWRSIRYKFGHKVYQYQNPNWRVNGRQRTAFTFSLSLTK